jgi:hypothetical protein
MYAPHTALQQWELDQRIKDAHHFASAQLEDPTQPYRRGIGFGIRLVRTGLQRLLGHRPAARAARGWSLPARALRQTDGDIP